MQLFEICETVAVCVGKTLEEKAVDQIWVMANPSFLTSILISSDIHDTVVKCW